MSQPNPHRARWDARYSADFQPRPPAAVLERWLPRLDVGTALDLACGTGRNALLLAEHGWRVLGVDMSPVALHIARSLSQERQLALDLLAVDLERWPLPTKYFDLICVFRYLDRSLSPSLSAALRPAGTLIFETFTVDQRHFEGGPRSDALLLHHGELPGLFPDLETLEYSEGIVVEDGRPRALAAFVGRKPARRVNNEE